MNNYLTLKLFRKKSFILFRKLHFLFVSVLFLFLNAVVLNAQTSTVSGIVSDNLGEPIIGANVIEKGTTNGTITDLDGNFNLSVPMNATITISYIGYHSQDVVFTGQSKLEITLIDDTQALDEVVVTALGIKRDKKSLGYSLQEVKGDDLLETRDANVANALAGKVAGLQIKQAGTGPAGSSRIVLRGNNSIQGNNQPLVVVDGVPIDSNTGGSEDFWGNKAVDRGSGMADISPDDIETISVLKGPAAAALYGSRAGNGVIMITTKTGAGQKGIGISVNSNLTFDSPMELPEYQNKYGQGNGGNYVVNATGSWGAEMKGESITDLGGRPTTYSPTDNELTDFLRTGTTWTNSVELTSSSDKNTFRASIMNLRNKGVVPNSSFGRTSATVRGTSKLTDKLSLDAKMTFINQKTDNRIKLAADPDNIFRNYLLMPRSVHFSDLRGYDNYAFPEGTIHPTTNDNISGRPASWTTSYGGLIRNPYWAAYKNTNNDTKNRLIAFGSLKYEFTDWLNIQGRYGIDFQSTQYQTRLASNTPYWEDQGFDMEKHTSYEANADFLINFNKQVSENFGIVASAGGNIMYRRSDGMTGTTGALIIPDFFTLANGKNRAATNYLTRKQINSLYATASFAYANALYLDVTARNDWSSTLNSENRSYFYPSVGASWLFMDSFEKWGINTQAFNYGKLRLSWAQVGNDTDPYQLVNTRRLSTSYVVNPITGQIETVLNGVKSDTRSLYELKNETINSWEIGLELKGLDNRLGLDFAFYNKEAKDQILSVNTPASSGFSYKYVNAGNVRNRGIEILLSGTPVRTKDFTWDVVLNFSKNKNKILELTEGVEQQILSDASISNRVQIVAREGGAFGDIYGKPYMRHENGEILLDANGLPAFDSDYVKLGNGSPKWMGGLTNSFRYKDFDLSFQIDMRYGGDVYMGSIQQGTNAGTLKMTEAGRESMLVEGVIADGSKNTVTTTSERYWAALQNGTEPWMYDATNIRLRELSFGYKLPRKVLMKTPIQMIKLSFVARNLWMIYSKTEGFDPESGYSTGNAQGFEFGSMPTLRSLGFNLNITF